MANNKLNDFKKVMENGMIENFKSFGFLTPVMFFLMNNQPMIKEIPSELLENSEGKQILSQIIKKICKEPNVTAGGIIIEAYAAKTNQDTELSKSLLNGDIRVSELKEKQDIIMMVFSSPEKEEMIAYNVDCKNKTVGEQFASDCDSFDGTFSNFFDRNKN
jgi:hypothetical protein